MAKTTKITVLATDYINAKHFADLLGIEFLEKSQIGGEINVTITYKDPTHIYKLGMVVYQARTTPPQPQSSDAGKKITGQKGKSS